jgi:mono/diheme cytochrome c family protein
MRAFAIALLFLLAACDDESLDKQNRLHTYAPPSGLSNWPSDSEAIPRVEGTVAQGDLERDRELAEPPAVSLALLQRGQERYDIYCAACHGLTGAGDGIVVARGFPRPRPLNDRVLAAAPARHIVDVIGNGTGRMYAFADRVDPKDRWAIAAYIRALQLAETSEAKP